MASANADDSDLTRTAAIVVLVFLWSSSPSSLAQQISDVHEHLQNPTAASDSEAKIARAKIDIRAIGTALDLYRLDNLRYPTTTEGLRALVQPPTDPAALSRWHRGGYLRVLPKDPWGHDYQYAYPSTHGQPFDLYSLGPSDDGNKMIKNWLTPSN
jgi:general secretion pathway protein G